MNFHKTILAILVVFAICNISHGSQEEKSGRDDNKDKIQILISRIKNLSFQEEPSESIKKNPEKLSKYWVEQADKRVAAKNELKEAMRNLAKMGDEAIEPIVDEIRGNPKIKYDEVLALIGTERAREILLDMALGRQGFEWSGLSATDSYLRVIKNKKEAAKLLVSDNVNVKIAALRHLIGVKVDYELFSILTSLLRQEDDSVILFAGKVLGADDNIELLEPKISLLIKLIKDQVRLFDKEAHKASLKKPIPMNYNRYIMYTDILCNIKGKGAKDILCEMAKKCDTLQVKRSIIIAMAHNGDKSVRKDMYAITKETEGEYIRVLAVSAFEYIGNSEDLLFLKNIEKTDTLERIIYTHKSVGNKVYSNWPQKIYPVRDKARRVVNIIECRENRKAANKR